MHPYIEEYINTATPVAELLDKYYESNETIAEIRKMRKGLFDSTIFEEAYLSAEQYATNTSEKDPVLLYAFYSVWVNAAHVYRRYEDLKMIYARSKEVCANPPPVLKLTCEQIYYNLMKKNEVRRYTKSNLKKYYHTSPRYQPFLIQAMITFCRMGEGNFLEDLVDTFVPKNLKKLDRWFLDYAYVVNDIVSGKLKSSEEDVRKLVQEQKALKFEHNYGLEEIELIRKLLKRQLPMEEIDTLNVSESLKGCLKCCYYLFDNNIEGALSLEAEREKVATINFSVSFFIYNSIRVKLSNMEYKSARNLLALKMNQNGMNYFDDFFRVRIFLLEENEEEAIKCFQRLYQNCLYFESLGLLDIELNLSLEIKPKHIRLLMSSIGHIKGKLSETDDVNLDDPVELKGVSNIIGKSLATELLRDQVQRIADIDMHVLISGETGVGKDLIANAIHEESSHCDDRFLPINCGAILDSLLLSELYGHEKGAFTGAIKSKKGLFETAQKGTVFLDEIGEISSKAQVALLRSLETGKIRPIGAAKDRPYSCRIITATNKSLEAMVKEKTFREDLFYRIRLIEIKVPPLRKRKEDIIPLINHFMIKYEKTVEENFEKELIEKFIVFDWPGNIRQLKSEVEKMCVLNQDKPILTLKECDFFKDAFISKTDLVIDKSESSKKLNFDEKLAAILAKSNSSKNRRHQLKKAFRKCPQLSRRDIIILLDVSASTADKELKVLLKENFIEKIMPTPARRTHFYQLVEVD